MRSAVGEGLEFVSLRLGSMGALRFGVSLFDSAAADVVAGFFRLRAIGATCVVRSRVT